MSRPVASNTFTRATLGATSAKTSSAERAAAGGAAGIGAGAATAFVSIGSAGSFAARATGSLSDARAMGRGAADGGGDLRTGADSRCVAHTVNAITMTIAPIHLPHVSRNDGAESQS